MPTKYVAFGGRLVMIGCGSIGQGVLPLILRHIDIPRERITIVTADARGAAVADENGIKRLVAPLTRADYRATLAPLLGPGDFLLNLSVGWLRTGAPWQVVAPIDLASKGLRISKPAPRFAGRMFSSYRNISSTQSRSRTSI